MALLAVENLSVSFGGLRAVDDVSFAVEEGQIYTLVGPNGAGKTTIFNLISGLYRPGAGAVRFRGTDTVGLSAHKIAALGIARTFQNIELFDHGSVLDNLLLGRHRHSATSLVEEFIHGRRVRAAELAGRQRAEEIIEFLDLQHYRRAGVQHLPYGVRKIVELGRALCSEPRLLLLDEPSSGLNTEETEDMAHWITDIRDLFGITVVMIEHDMTLVGEVSDRVLALNGGRVLAEGTSGEVQTHPEVVRAYLGD